jgi:hypothetical protein
MTVGWDGVWGGVASTLLKERLKGRVVWVLLRKARLVKTGRIGIALH